MNERIAKIRTSDRISFKRCRRRWGFSSSLKMNRQEDEARTPLWLGTGFHFAMEDYHGYNKYSHPSGAFKAYCEATRKAPSKRYPEDWKDGAELAIGMLDYYVEWLQTRNPLQTFWYNGKPQVEVRFEIPLPLPEELLRKYGWDAAVYQGTLDRVCIDEHDRLWILDFKTAKQFSITHLDTDPQVSAYTWAGTVLYPNKPIAGMIYQQHKKVVPTGPEFLSSSKRFSTAKLQATTHRLYKKALDNLYGQAKNAPAGNIEFLNYLASIEGPDEDPLIRRDWEYRNITQLEAEGEKILMEVADMLNPDLSMYPNPTRDCSWDCFGKAACIMMDDGSDWESELMTSTISRDDEDDNWRNYL